MNKLLLDIQTAYANGINKIEILESYLTFETARLFKGLLLCKDLQIFPVDDTLKFTGELFDMNWTPKELKELKQKNNKNIMKNILLDKMAEKYIKNKKDYIQDELAEKLIEDIESIDEEDFDDDPFENDIKPNAAPKNVKKIYNIIKRMFKNIRIIKFDNNQYTITSDMTSICLNNKQIELLYTLINTYNIEFKILGKYDYESEEDETCYGVKFLWNYIEK